jgi:hypothetical protein
MISLDRRSDLTLLKYKTELIVTAPELWSRSHIISLES